MSDKPITQLLSEIKSGRQEVLGELLPLVYDELRRLADNYLRRERSDHTLQPTALVHEAYLRLVGQNPIEWQNRAHFFGIAARLMREILIEYARGRNRQKRGGAYKTQIAVSDAVSFNDEEQFDVIAVDEALNMLEKLDERQARIVELKFFGGLKNEEIAEVLNISVSTITREWEMARTWLYRELKK